MTPQLTDRSALDRNRRRALRHGPAATFLHDAAIDDVKERLEMVNKTFTDIAIVTGHPDLWQAAFPAARLVPDAPRLDLQPQAHDLVIHAMALHWADDPLGQIVQCRLALRPDGLFLGILPGGQTLHELRAALAEAEAARTGGLSPRVLPMAEIRDLGGLLHRAGLALPVADGFARTVLYRDLFHLCADLRAMGEGNALSARLRRPSGRGLFLQAAEIYRQAHARGDRIAATFDLIALTGWSPHESQQQPLRPGSALQSLAQALGTVELGGKAPQSD